MTPPPPFITLQHPREGPEGLGRVGLGVRHFLMYFSLTHRTDMSRFRGTFHSFVPVGFAIFANPAPTVGDAAFLQLLPLTPVINRIVEVSNFAQTQGRTKA